MRKRIIGSFTAALVVAAAGCRSSGQSATLAESPAAVVACSATVPGAALSEWKEVAAKGFTFCVPGDWSQHDRRWQARSSNVEWNTGDPPSTAPTRFVVTGPAPGSPPGAPGSVGGMVRPEDPFSARENIGGQLAELSRVRISGRYHTSSVWRGQKIHLRGDAGDLAAAGVHFTIYRTVRFTPAG
jgi:hypothetical protein